MPGNIVVVMDTLSVRAEVLAYALELAARTASSLVVLVILTPEKAMGVAPDGEWKIRVERTTEAALLPHVNTAREAGVGLTYVLRLGVPSSELIKFLAESRTVHTIIWGGEPDLVGKKPQDKRDHWLARIRDTLACPVVVPVSRPEVDKTA